MNDKKVAHGLPKPDPFLPPDATSTIRLGYDELRQTPYAFVLDEWTCGKTQHKQVRFPYYEVGGDFERVQKAMCSGTPVSAWRVPATWVSVVVCIGMIVALYKGCAG